MGEIADMMLDGTLDEETGEYIGDDNLERFGSESPGFPVSYEREARERIARKKPHGEYLKGKKVSCPTCDKRVKEIGLWQHMKDVHGERD